MNDVSLPSNSFYPMYPAQITTFDSTTGLPLAAGIYTFFEDDNRTVPKNVYQRTENPDNSFTYVSLGNSLTLSAIGTFVDSSGNNIIPFLWPFQGSPDDSPVSTVIQLYYITVTSSGLTPEFTVSAWPPEVTSPGTAATTFVESDNIISNPQFAVVNFESPVTLTVSGNSTIQIAPDWNVITTGSGTITLSQIPVNDTGAPGLPAFALQIGSASVSSLILSQTISNSPRILETGYASGTFIAESTTMNTPTITMNFVPSSPALSPIVLASGEAASGSYTLVASTAQVSPPSLAINSQGGDVGYVNIQLSIPVNNTVNISCVQVVSVPNTSPLIIAGYAQQSTPRQIDHLFHYYNPKLMFKPIPSWLVGWDFPLNPCQALGPAPRLTGASTGQYIADQTILFQTVPSNFTVSVTGAAGLIITATAASTFSIMQYIDGPRAMEILNQNMSVLLQGIVSTGTINATIDLLWTTNAAVPILPLTVVTSVGAGPVPVYNTTWNVVPRVIGTASLQLNQANIDYAFKGWLATAAPGATYFAIVINFDTAAIGASIQIERIGLVSGDIPTRPAPQTLDQVLRECERYYQSTFLSGTAPTAGVGKYTGELYGVFNTSSPYFFVTYATPLRAAPTGNITFYNPVVANNAFVYDITASASWTATATIASTVSANGFVFQVSGSTPSGYNAGDLQAVHWSADARLGVV